MQTDTLEPVILSGNANRPLAMKIAEHLNCPLAAAVVDRFSDGEIRIEVKETVRGKDVFVIQPTCAPVNDHLVELLLLIDALYRASAARITAVMPYFGYCRQDRKPRFTRVPISAKVAAKMISSVSASRILTVDLHSDQIQGFFDVPVDNVYASPVFLKDIEKMLQKSPSLVVVSPDVGGVVRARALAKRLGDADLVIIDKRRPRPNEAHVMNIIGDVKGKQCVIVDDLVDTGGTICSAATALKKQGAAMVVAYATHSVLSGDAVNRIQNSQLDEIVVSDTIPLYDSSRNCSKIRQLSVAELLAKAVYRVNRSESLSSLFAG